MNFVKNLRREAHQFNREVYAFYLALKDQERVPGAARLLVVLGLVYTVSPMDLIPDPMAIFGYLDDLVVVPMLLALASRMIPERVLGEARAQSYASYGRDSHRVHPAITFLWVLLTFSALLFLYKFL